MTDPPGMSTAARPSADTEVLHPRQLRQRLADALAETGLPVCDPDPPGLPGAGCCLTPAAGDHDHPPGVIVSWSCAESLTSNRERWEQQRIVQEAMVEALWTLVEAAGFQAQPFGTFYLPLVVAAPRRTPQEPRPWPLEDLGDRPDPCRPPLYVGLMARRSDDAEGRLGRPCARCATPVTHLHYPQARESTAVCCGCFDGHVLVADHEHPEGHWLEVGPCRGHQP